MGRTGHSWHGVRRGSRRRGWSRWASNEADLRPDVSLSTDPGCCSIEIQELLTSSQALVIAELQREPKSRVQTRSTCCWPRVSCAAAQMSLDALAPMPGSDLARSGRRAEETTRHRPRSQLRAGAEVPWRTLSRTGGHRGPQDASSRRSNMVGLAVAGKSPSVVGRPRRGESAW